MKKVVLYFLLIIANYSFSQEIANLSNKKDSIPYAKDLSYIEKRTYKLDLKTKYNNSDFVYIEKKPSKPKPNNYRFWEIFYKGFFNFMKLIFPFLLAAIVIFIILKMYLGVNSNFWNLKKKNNTIIEKLVIHEDEDIHDTDIEGLLKKALESKNSRLAIRYYYLLLLKKCSEKELIKYDKDKTNSDYLFEIEDVKKRKKFSYLSYIYTYVWYGEFPLNEDDFLKVEKKYKSFFNTIN